MSKKFYTSKEGLIISNINKNNFKIYSYILHVVYGCKRFEHPTFSVSTAMIKKIYIYR